MESVGVYLKEDWDYSLNKMFSGADESHCMLHWLQNFGTPSEISATDDGSVAMFDEDALFYSSENPNPDFYLSQDIADSSISASNYSSGYFSNNFSNFNHMISTPLTMNDMIPHESINHRANHDEHDNFLPLGDLRSEENVNIGLCLKEEILGKADSISTDLITKRKFEELKQSEFVDKDNRIILASNQNPKKKCRVPRDTTKNKRNSPGKNNQQLVQMNKNDKDQSVNMLIRSGSYSSEDDSNASQEPNGGSSESKDSAALNSSGKARAGRGAATDPQSLYARKRREKINERLRILQHLVPNGTKVDISTMLEEAVQYVKFLQLQIKLLSSDNTWMYAPIAYNGMDMGLYKNISPAI